MISSNLFSMAAAWAASTQSCYCVKYVVCICFVVSHFCSPDTISLIPFLCGLLALNLVYSTYDDRNDVATLTIIQGVSKLLMLLTSGSTGKSFKI